MPQGSLHWSLAVFLVMPLPASAIQPDDSAAPLRRLRDSIKTLEVTQRLTVEDRNADGSRRSGEQMVRIFFDRRSERIRRELLSVTPMPKPVKSLSRSMTGTIRPDGPKVAVGTATLPEPRWLFGLPEALGAFRGRLRHEDGRDVVDLRARQGRGNRIEKDITFDPQDLPIRVRAFGSRNEVVDEALIRWERAGASRFPAEITLVQRSRLNTVTTVARFTDVRLNQPIAASLFSAQ